MNGWLSAVASAMLCGSVVAGLLAPASARGASPDMSRRVFAVPTVVVPDAEARAGEPIQPFSLAPATRSLQDLEDARYTRSFTSVRVDHAELQKLVAGEKATFEIATGGDAPLIVEVREIRRRGPRTATLLGRLRDDDAGHVVLVVHEGVLSGSIARYGMHEHYEINTLEDGTVLIRLLDEIAFMERCGTHDDVAPTDLAAAGSVRPEPTAQGGGLTVSLDEAPVDEADPPVITMDIVVGYGAEARLAEGGTSAMEAKIIASVDRMNTAFANSGVTNVELVLLGTIEDPDYVFRGAISNTMASADELGYLDTHGDGLLDVVSQLRIDLGADLNAFVIKDTDGSAGIARQPGRSCVVARTYMTSASITFVHEVAHNVGCRHAWGDSDCTSTYHGRAWRMDAVGSKYRTVMSYDADWTRIPWFSNPDVLYAGVRTGATNGYDATGDTTTDSRLVDGGYSGACTNGGYDGSHADLGANNALYIMDNAAGVEDNAARAALGIVSPAADDVLVRGALYTIEWVGGVYGGTVALDLYAGGVSNRSIATGLANNDWRHDWPVLLDVPCASNYTIRITVDGAESADSAEFWIFSTVLSCSMTTLASTVVMGGDATSQTFEVWNAGATESNMLYTVATNANWLSVSPVSGASMGDHDVIQVDYATSGLATGLYSAAITVAAPGAGASPTVIDVALTVVPPPPIDQSLPYIQTFGSGLPGRAEGWGYYSEPDGRIQVVDGMLRMDRFPSGIYVLNEAVLYLDLAGAANVVLSFDHIDHGDELDPLPASFSGHAYGDGVSFSADGETWYLLINLTNTFMAREFDLDAAVQTAGIVYAAGFQVKFQQYDNYPYPSDGRSFDNVRIEERSVIQAVQLAGSNLWLLQVQSASNWQYVLQYSTDLLTDTWHNVSTSVGDGSVLDILHSNDFDRAFYKLGVLPPE